MTIMKKALLTLCMGILVQTSFAQTAADTLTTADMPVAGDTLRHSTASPADTTAATLITTVGASQTWDFSYLVATSQTVDSYLTASQVNPLYALQVPSGAYGYKVLDSLTIPIPGTPISMKNLYTFFKKNTTLNSFQADAFGASISGFPLAFTYSTPDDWYFFPLAFGKPTDSSNYSLTMTVPGIGTIKRNGYRLTTTVGFGTVLTPYYTTAQNCIMVMSEIHEIDSVLLTALPFPLGLPQNTVEYKWLIQGEHYPAVWIVTPYPSTGTITSINYRDNYHYFPPLAVKNEAPTFIEISASPNPSHDGQFNLNIPAEWQNFQVQVFDMMGKQVAVFNNKHNLNLVSFPSGQYIGIVTAGDNRAFVHLTK